MSDSLRVAILSPYDFYYHGGVNSHVRNLHYQLVAKGLHSKVIAPFTGDIASAPEWLIPFGKSIPLKIGGSIARISFSLKTYFQIQNFLSENFFDVIHVHEPFGGAITLGAINPKIQNDSVRVATFHSFEGSSMYRFIPDKILRNFFNNLDGKIAVSDSAKNYVNKFLESDYRIIPNGIDLVDEIVEDQYQIIDDKKINILFVGRFEKRKGLFFLIQSYLNLKQKYENIRLLIAGGGELDSESQKILSSRNSKDIIFLGEVTELQKKNLFDKAHIFCAPSTGQESFGIVLLESMRSGTCLVATNIEGYKNVVQHMNQGLLSDPKNVSSLQGNLEMLINDEKLRKQLGTNGLKSVQKYDWDLVSRDVLSFYRELILERRI